MPTRISQPWAGHDGTGSRPPSVTPTMIATTAVEAVEIATGPAGPRRSFQPRPMISREPAYENAVTIPRPTPSGGVRPFGTPPPEPAYRTRKTVGVWGLTWANL